MKKYLFIFAGFLILLIIVFLLQSFIRSNLGFMGKSTSVKFGDETVKLEIADTEKKREIGLSGKKSLPEKQGMLFIFETPGFYNFWMKDMKFPIDIIFLRDNKIVSIYENVPAPDEDSENLDLYSPKQEANQVIELNAGKAKTYGLVEGQELEIKL